MSEQTVNNDPTNTVVATPQTNTATSVATTVTTIDLNEERKRIRTEEKNKLYPEIEKLKGQLEDVTAKLDDALAVIGMRDKEIVKINKKVEEAKTEGVTNMDKTVQELQAELNKLTKQLEEKDGEITKVKTEYELKDYRTSKAKDVDESVLDLVTGSTKEEIDASIEIAKATYDKIASKFQTAPQTTVPPVNSVANQIPPVNMSTVNSDIFKGMSLEDLWKLDPKSPEYANLRKQLGFK